MITRTGWSEAPGIVEEVVQFGPLTIARATHAPGWRWSKDIKPIVGTERCQIRHVGVVLSGRIGVELADGASIVECGGLEEQSGNSQRLGGRFGTEAAGRQGAVDVDPEQIARSLTP